MHEKVGEICDILRLEASFSVKDNKYIDLLSDNKLVVFGVIQARGLPGRKRSKMTEEEEAEIKRKEHIKGHEKLAQEYDEIVKKLKTDLDQAKEDLKIICACLASNVGNKHYLKKIAMGDHHIMQKYYSNQQAQKAVQGDASLILKRAKSQLDMIARPSKKAKH